MDYETDTSWVRSLLQPGESLLWSGKPGKIRLLGKEDIFLIPFSLFWCGFLGFTIRNTWQDDNTALPFKLFFLPFIAVGLWMLVGRFVWKLLTLRKERYALTSQRIIIQSGKERKTLELASLPQISVTERADGSGDIHFGQQLQTYYGASGFRSDRQRVYRSNIPAFHAIADVNRVEYRIRQAAEQLRDARG